MTISTSFRTVLTLLAVAVLAGLLATACGPACGSLCDSDFWIDENNDAKNPSVADVQAEIDDGADLTGPDDGLSPLGWALGRGSPEVVELLLESGADPKADQHLFLCVWTADDSIETAKKMDLMLYHGADVNLECALGGTPLTKAIQTSGNVQLVETMILYGADVNVEGGGGMTPLILGSGGPERQAGGSWRDGAPATTTRCRSQRGDGVYSDRHFTQRSVWATLIPFVRFWNTARVWMLPTTKVIRPVSKVGK